MNIAKEDGMKIIFKPTWTAMIIMALLIVAGIGKVKRNKESVLFRFLHGKRKRHGCRN